LRAVMTSGSGVTAMSDAMVTSASEGEA